MILILESFSSPLRERFEWKIFMAFDDISIPITSFMSESGNSFRTLIALNPDAVSASRNLKVLLSYLLLISIYVLTTNNDISLLKT